MVKKTYNEMIYISVIILVLFISVGYSILTSTLKMNGSSSISRASWNVFFDNIVVKTGSVTPTTAATINEDKDTVGFGITLNKPGEFYEFTVDVKNTGTIDAMIDTITKTVLTEEQSKYLRYTVTYNDNITPASKHRLNAQVTEKYKVRVEYRTDLNPNELPTSQQNINLEFGVKYVQNTSEGITRPTS